MTLRAYVLPGSPLVEVERNGSGYGSIPPDEARELSELIEMREVETREDAAAREFAEELREAAEATAANAEIIDMEERLR